MARYGYRKPPADLPADAIAWAAHDGTRWRIWHANGNPSNTLARDESRDDLKAILARYGLTLRDDNSIIRS